MRQISSVFLSLAAVAALLLTPRRARRDLWPWLWLAIFGLVTALGVGLASSLKGRNPMLDGFGLIAFASLFPMMTVMGYAQLPEWWARARVRHGQEG